jgi:hypothetical protein
MLSEYVSTPMLTESLIRRSVSAAENVISDWIYFIAREVNRVEGILTAAYPYQHHAGTGWHFESLLSYLVRYPVDIEK